jgi:hypothetical protein
MLVEPLAAAVYFSPEATQAYTDLGAVEDFWAPYYASRGACLGETPATAVAAAFGVFHPGHMREALAEAWKVATPAQWWAARVTGATAQLERLLGTAPDGAERATALLRRLAESACVAGHPLYAGLAEQAWPGTVVGDLWHAADLVREHRGDTHTAAWIAAGLSGPEVMMLTELWWGLPHGLYLATRHWPDDAIAAGLERLRARGLVDGDPPALTDAGIQMRADLERATDAAELPILDALTSAEQDELLDLLAPWADTICQGGGYPTNPAARTLPGLEDE